MGPAIRRDFELRSSEGVPGVQVCKAQSADLIAGGVAATINISTIDALDYRGPNVPAERERPLRLR